MANIGDVHFESLFEENRRVAQKSIRNIDIFMAAGNVNVAASQTHLGGCVRAHLAQERRVGAREAKE